MELLAELVAGLFQFILEVLLQLLADVFAEIGLEALKEVVKPSRPPHRGLATFGYSLVGSAAGGLSLFWFPLRFAGSTGLRFAVLILAPVASALSLWLGLKLLARPADPEARRRRFWYAYAFGLAFAAVRFTYGQ